MFSDRSAKVNKIAVARAFETGVSRGRNRANEAETEQKPSNQKVNLTPNLAWKPGFHRSSFL